MDFEIEHKINFPRKIVYPTLRDELVELVPFIPNIKKIEIIEKKKTKGGVYYVNQWYGDYNIPKIVAKIIKIDQLTWFDKANWKDGEYACEWEFEPIFFKEYIEARGRNEFLEDGDGTRVVLRGSMNIDVSNHPAVPWFLKNRVNKELSRLILAVIKPNMIKLMKGLEGYLKKKK